MKWRRSAAHLLPAATLGALLALGCSGTTDGVSGSGATPRGVAPDGSPLRDVALPDLSKMVLSAQTQIRNQHESLQKTIGRRGVTPEELSHAYGEMGKLLLAAQYGDPAEAALLNAQALDASDYRWPYYLAQHYRTQGDPAKTQQLLERTLQLRPQDVPSLVWLGDTWLALGDANAAAVQFSKALAVDSQLAAAHAGLGRAALALDDPRRAVAELETALTIDPQAVGAHYPLSLAYNAIGDRQRAQVHLQKRQERPVLPPDPLMAELDTLLESPQRYETQGIRALVRNDWPAAAAEFRKGLALDPASPALRHRLATAINMMGEKEEAEAIFAAVARDAPDYFPTRFSLGVILQSKRRDGEAIEHFRAALQQRSDYAEARLRMASSLRRLGRLPDAIANYEQVLTANPNLLEARVGVAMTLASAGRDREARDILLDGMKADPDQPAFSHGMARLLAASPDAEVRDGQAAMGLVQQLLKKGRTPDLGETMAMALAELGEYERAASLQRDLIMSAQNANVPVSPRLTANLRLYEQRRASRVPWTDEEMP